jgi:hypothetical protein
MPYNTISLIDKNGNEQIFDIMTITLEEHLVQAIRRGCELCKKHGADGFQINYCLAGNSCGKSVRYDASGNEIGAEVWND